MIVNLLILSLLIFVFNIPFGYWRANVRKLSFQWFVSIHIPVPFVIWLRIVSDIGFIWYSYPLFVGAFFLGQFAGKKVYSIWKSIKNESLSSLIFVDLFKK